MATFSGFYEASGGTVAKDPQAVATLFEAEPNIASAEVLGSVGEAFGGTGSAGRVEILVTTIDEGDWAGAINEAGFDATETDLTYDTGTGTQPTDFPFVILIESERIVVSSDTGDGVTGTDAVIIRAFDGTTGATHADSTAFTLSVDAGDLALAATAAGAKLASGRPAAA